MAPVSSLRNLGPAMEKYCAEAGVTSAAQLKKLGYLEVYLRLKARYPRHMNRMALYALYGALTNQDCMALPQAIKDRLERELQAGLKRQPHAAAGLPLSELP
jgi:DNA transformation protein